MSFEKREENRKQILYLIIHISACVIWPLMYVGTVSYISTYIVLGILGIVSFFYLGNDDKSPKYWLVISFIISAAWTLSDYSIFLQSKIAYAKSVIAFLTGWYVINVLIRSLLKLVDSRNASLAGISNTKTGCKSKRKYCVLTFIFTSLIDLAYLFTVAYPGWITTDTASQIGQMFSGNYTNHHPYWHTRLMELFIKPVYAWTGDGNMAFASYSIFQIIVISLIFTYFIDTLFELRIRKRIIIAVMIIMIIAPYNIAMSCALIKDTAFSMAVFTLAITVYRELSDISNKKRLNRILLGLSTVCSCLFRTNGIIAVTMLILISILIFGKEKQYRAFLMIMVSGWCIACLMNYGCLRVIGVEQPDTVEALSIPLQQLARTSLEGNIDGDQLRYINSIVDYNKLSEVYENRISDNVKNLIREEGNQIIIKEDKVTFLKYWISIGIKNPVCYVKAWVDQTRGYWCPSDVYSTWLWGISDRLDFSAYNVQRKEGNRICQAVWEVWSGLWDKNYIPAFELLLAAGLWFWITVVVGIYSIVKKKKEMVICILPVTIVCSLLIATPVSNMFRYVYALFLCLPMILIAISKKE